MTIGDQANHGAGKFIERDERLRHIHFPAIERREAIPIFLYLRRGHPTRHEAIYTNSFSCSQPSMVVSRMTPAFATS